MRCRAVACVLLVSLALAGCVGEDAVEPEPDARTSPEAPAGEPDETPETGAGVQGADDSRDEGTSPGLETVEEAFRSWLAASREPDVDLACSYLADELVEKMLAEMEANGYPSMSGCEELTRTTAEMYRAVNASDEVTINVVSETHTTAELFVTYVDGGDCGTVAMKRTTGGWLITEQSEGCVE